MAREEVHIKGTSLEGGQSEKVDNTELELRMVFLFLIHIFSQVRWPCSQSHVKLGTAISEK